MVVILGVAIVWQLTKKKLPTIVMALVMTLNPWMIQFSRIAFEAIWVLLFYLGFVFFWFRFWEKKRYFDFYISLALLGLSVYCYRTMSLYVPLTVIVLILIYRGELFRLPWKHLLLGLLLLAGVTGPFVYLTTIASADQPRINQISIFSNKNVPIFVLRDREVDSGDLTSKELGRKPSKLSFLFHSKPLGWWYAFKNNYLAAFSTEFLFLNGDTNLRHSVGKYGELMLVDLIGLIAGGYWLIKKWKDRHFQFLALWLLTAPIASALTLDGAGHASRLVILAPPLLILVALGWWQVVMVVKKLFGRLTMSLLYFGMFGLVLLNFTFFYHRLLVHYPLESARWFGYGYQQVAEKALMSGYTNIALTDSLDPPMLYYLFWAKVPAKQVQAYGSEFGREVIKGQPLDRVKPFNWSKLTETLKIKTEIGSVLEPDTIYAVTRAELPLDLREGRELPPKGVKLIDIILYPDNEVAFYLLARGEEKSLDFARDDLNGQLTK